MEKYFPIRSGLYQNVERRKESTKLFNVDSPSSKADWIMWKLKPTASLWEACYLSLGLNPRISIDLDMGVHTARKYIGILSEARVIVDLHKSVSDRIEVAVSNLIENGGMLNIFRKENHGVHNIVRLSEFGTWAKSIGWDLPPEFPTEQLKTVNENITKSPDEKVTTAGGEDIEPIKGRPETLRKWMEHVITVEKGLSLSDEMPDGLQAQLIERAREYGYIDGTAVKKAWSALGLQSVRKTTKMKKTTKTP